jgi:hypothetical protein
MIGTAEAVPFHKASHSVFSCKLCGPAQLQSKPDWGFSASCEGIPFTKQGGLGFSASCEGVSVP